MSFAEGFFTTSANAITARKMEIRDRRAKDRDYLMTYGTQAITKAREGADSVANIAGILQSEYNFSPKNIAFLVDKTGVAGLSSLYDKVKDFTSQEAKASNFNGLFKGVEDYVYDSEKDLKQQIEKAFGLYKSNVTTDPQENERVGFLASLGLDIFNDGGEEFTTVGGYNIEDARRIGATPAASMSNPLGSIFDTTKLPRKLSSFELGATTKYVEGAIEGIATAYINDGKVTAREASKINNLITEKNWAELSAMPVLKEKLNSRFFNYEEEYGILGSNPGLSYLKKNGLLEEIKKAVPLVPGTVEYNTKALDNFSSLEVFEGLKIPTLDEVPTFKTVKELKESNSIFGIIDNKLATDRSPIKINNARKTQSAAVTGGSVTGDSVDKNDVVNTTMEDLTAAQQEVVLGIVKEFVDKEVNLQNAKRRKGRVANNMSGVEETALRESLSGELLPTAIEEFEKREAKAVIRPNPRLRNIGG